MNPNINDSINNNNKKISQNFMSESEKLSDCYVRKIKTLYTLPDIYIKLKTELDNPESTINDIGLIIQYDVVLSARVMSLINSAFFGFDKKITNIAHAVSILGLDTITKIVLNTSIASVFKDIPPTKINMKSFWKWSVMSALTAQEIARKADYTNPEDMFTAALLHNIGQLVMLAQSSRSIKKVYEKANLNIGLSVMEAELDVFGFTHTQVGASLLKLWKLPNVFQDVAKHHHYPVFHTEHCQEISIVYLAVLLTDYVKKHHQFHPQVFNNEAMISITAILNLGLKPAVFKEIVMHAQDQVSDTIKNIYTTESYSIAA